MEKYLIHNDDGKAREITICIVNANSPQEAMEEAVTNDKCSFYSEVTKTDIIGVDLEERYALVVTKLDDVETIG